METTLLINGKEWLAGFLVPRVTPDLKIGVEGGTLCFVFNGRSSTERVIYSLKGVEELIPPRIATQDARIAELEEKLKIRDRHIDSFIAHNKESSKKLEDILLKRCDAKDARIAELEKRLVWLDKAHSVANGFLDKPSQSHIIDKICIIGWERDNLRRRYEAQMEVMREAKEGFEYAEEAAHNSPYDNKATYTDILAKLNELIGGR